MNLRELNPVWPDGNKRLQIDCPKCGSKHRLTIRLNGLQAWQLIERHPVTIVPSYRSEVCGAHFNITGDEVKEYPQ